MHRTDTLVIHFQNESGAAKTVRRTFADNAGPSDVLDEHSVEIDGVQVPLLPNQESSTMVLVSVPGRPLSCNMDLFDGQEFQEQDFYAGLTVAGFVNPGGGKNWEVEGQAGPIEIGPIVLTEGEDHNTVQVRLR